jgi:4-methylaminobutanoate oxidase (formaldehyde-forming)
VSSGAYGHYVGASVGMGWLKNKDGVTKEFMEAGDYSVLIANEEFAVDVSFSASYDPKGERVKM